MILVINADDAGIDAPRNRGILRAARAGAVRSTSLLAAFPASEELIASARGVAGLGIGLHLNLTEGRPLVPGQRSLTGEDGRFPGKREVFRRAMAGRIEVAEARREIEAQWAWMEARGAHPTHVDGHNHAHLLPGIAEALREAVPAGTWVRGSAGGAGPAGLDPERMREAAFDAYAGGETLAAVLRLLTARALESGWRKFRMASRFIGPSIRPGRGPLDLVAILEKLEGREGEVIELMMHPGETAADSVPFSADEGRLREMEALIDPRLLSFTRERGIRLVGFGDMP